MFYQPDFGVGKYDRGIERQVFRGRMQPRHVRHGREEGMPMNPRDGGQICCYGSPDKRHGRLAAKRRKSRKEEGDRRRLG
jgi:hypothetical protein